ncbi:MAG: hypothetical protein ACRDSJ_11150 [Rubrobacteraceae bacterium]
MMKSISSKVMWIGRATVFLIGLSVILAVVMGVASMAFAKNGKPFILGKNNVASAITTLIKQGPGPALNLRVDSGPPLKVNSAEVVPNLNADKLDGRDASTFADGAGGVASNADELDGKDSDELPGAVAQMAAIKGDTSDAEPFGALVFVTDPVTLTTTSSTQRFVGVVSAPLKIVADPGTGEGPLEFRYGLCYRQAGTTNPLAPFYSGPDEARGTATTTPTSWTAAQTRVPGLVSAWEVGFCARNGSNQFQTLTGAGTANGWIEVVNPSP